MSKIEEREMLVNNALNALYEASDDDNVDEYNIIIYLTTDQILWF